MKQCTICGSRYINSSLHAHCCIFYLEYLLIITFPQRYSYFYISSVFLKKVKKARLWSSENEKTVLEGIVMFRELFYITFPRRYSYFYCSSVFLKKVKQATLWASNKKKTLRTYVYLRVKSEVSK